MLLKNLILGSLLVFFVSLAHAMEPEENNPHTKGSNHIQDEYMDIRILLATTKIYQSQKQYPEAFNTISRALQRAYENKANKRDKKLVGTIHAKIGEYFWDGLGTKKDPENGVAHLQIAFDYYKVANPITNVILSLYHKERKEYELSVNKLLQVLPAGSQGEIAWWAILHNNLGQCYLEGKGTPKDPKKGMEHLEIAAKYGLADAMYNCGLHYNNGIHTKKNPQKAIRYFEDAAERGDILSMETLLKLYSKGSDYFNLTEASRIAIMLKKAKSTSKDH